MLFSCVFLTLAAAVCPKGSAQCIPVESEVSAKHLRRLPPGGRSPLHEPHLRSEEDA